MLKPSAPGLTISITPMNPIPMASMRRQPTASRRITAEASVTASGTTCKIAVTLASGMFTSAVRKK